jgi:wyosine [tRNA(Phe)-imidazoG37] synthetase (radical SAM superfamily)
MNFTQFIQYRALSAKANIEGQTFNSQATEALIEKAAAANPAEFKTVCAPLSIPLFDRLSNTLSILDISKRKFIEAAIVEALEKAEEIIKQVDVFEGCAPFEAHEEA